MNVEKITGKIVLQKQIDFDRVYERTASKNNQTSCKVTLPKELDGKKVYVIAELDNKIKLGGEDVATKK